MSRATNERRVVVVTGASSGIGRATALAFAGHGDRLVLSARSAVSLAEVAAACRARGAPVRTVAADVTVPATVTAVADAAVSAFGRIDVWVHTAAVMAYGRFEDVPAEIFDRVVHTDLLGAATVARVALARFRAQGTGVLVLGGSLLGKVVTPYMSSYVTSKWGLCGLVRVLQVEHRDRPGVHVCLVDPGSVDTPIYRKAANYAGFVGRPPPPVDSPEKVAAAIVRCARRPKATVSVGFAGSLVRFGFVMFPRVYDRLVGPLTRGVALSREAVPAHEGNVFAADPAGNAVHGQWGRHWLRPVGAAAAVTVLGGVVAGMAAHHRARAR